MKNGFFEPTGSNLTEYKNENGRTMRMEEENDEDRIRDKVPVEVEKIEREQEGGQMVATED